MKKGILIILLILISLFTLLTVSGMEKRYFYVNAKDNSENIFIIKQPDFSLQLTATPQKDSLNNFHVDLTFNNLSKNIFIEKSEITIINNLNGEIELKGVSATDGFYNWVEEKNGKAQTFDQLPKHLKTISKDIEAYFLYDWDFKSSGMAKDNLEIRVYQKIMIEDKIIVINKNFKLKLIDEIIYRSLIRFH
jgi:hypothetical protein